MKIAIGCDHAGYELKEKLKEHLEGLNHVILDCGTYSETSVDYPDFGHAVGKEINSNNIKLGVLICGSGNGISMVANKYKNVNTEVNELFDGYVKAVVNYFKMKEIEMKNEYNKDSDEVDTLFENINDEKEPATNYNSLWGKSIIKRDKH